MARVGQSVKRSNVASPLVGDVGAGVPRIGYNRLMIHDAQPTHAPSESIGLYVHVPFCETKCGYCDFYSVPLEGRETGAVVKGTVRELTLRLSERRKTVRTVFIGGGTPTLLPADQLALLLAAVKSLVDVPHLEEFTVEANPATVDDEKARTLVAHGVSRVSMGAQSFFPNELAALERIHSPEDIAPSVATLRRFGITQLNLDLIFGIPGQTLATWSESLRRAIDLGPDHLACYGLTYEPGTRLTAQLRTGRVTPCDEDLEVDLYQAGIDAMESAGYRQYEISNFAKPGCESRHNLIYWRNEPYLGVGPSATGCVDRRRYKNVCDLGAYVRGIDERGHAEAEHEIIDSEKLALEMILMQLRLNEGLSIRDFRRRTGLDPRITFAAALQRRVSDGLLTVNADRIALTRSGRLVANHVMVELAREIGTSPDVPLPVLA